MINADNHGTHVAGTVAATTNNNIGVAGVAGGNGSGDGVRLMSCALAFGPNSIGFDEAYIYAADNGAVISQNSWGYINPGAFDQSVLDAIDYFIAEAGYDADGNPVGPMQGGIVIFAAGNDGDDDRYYPGYYSPVLAVASTDSNDYLSSFSNFGDWVDIAAPGSSVYSTFPNDSYGYLSGTSMACPHVSGVAALIVSEFAGNITPSELRSRLIDNTDPVLFNAGSGRLNAFAALNAEAKDTNLALNKTVTATGTADGDHIPSNVVDGSINTRWSSRDFPKSFVVDLGAEYDIDRTELICLNNRAYQYRVEVAVTSNDSYIEVVDRSSNTTEGSVSSPITDTFSPTTARYVRMTVSGASGYEGSWVSLLEFRVFGSETSDFDPIDPTPNCSEGSNLSLNGDISSFSGEQDANPARNLIDDDTSNRWSAMAFPQNVVIDLGDIYDVNEINLYPFNNRAYQFLVEGSSSSSSSGFSTLTNATNNTLGGSVINRTFSSRSVRYVRLTITGASGYTGPWASIQEFEIICSGSQSNAENSIATTASTNSLESISVYPNPFTTNLTVALSPEDTEVVKAQLIDVYGREVAKVLKTEESLNTMNLSTNLPQGMYFLRLLNINDKIIKTEKVIRN